jgi:hypothetical protein
MAASGLFDRSSGRSDLALLLTRNTKAEKTGPVNSIRSECPYILGIGS